MDKAVENQILAIRDTGETNMFDVPKVQEIAFRKGYFELVEYLSEHSAEYSKFILTGEG